jgi:hypothetical protein
MTRARDNADGARLDAPLASPTFTGTVAGVTGTHITTGTLGNTVQDNITRLGTVTSGNLSNTAIVYPAGHVLQVKSDTSVSASMDVTTTASRPYGTDLQVEITAPTSNYLFVNVFIAGYWNFTSSTHSLHAGLKYSTDNWTTQITLGPRVFPLSHFGYLNSATAFLSDASFSTWVQVPTASAMKIQIYCISTIGTVRLHANQSSDTTVGREASCLTVMEVQA